MPNPIRVAVTGSAGSGKSSVCRYLKEKGLSVIDLDSLSRSVVERGSLALDIIKAEFGSKAINSENNLNRRYLRELIISDSNLKKKLEDILHPLIIAGMNKKIDEVFQRGEGLVIVEVPLLFETGMDKMFDLVVVVICDPYDRITRLSQRDGVSAQDAAALVSIQMPDASRAGMAGYLINNSGGVAELADESDRLHNYLKSLRLDN